MKKENKIISFNNYKNECITHNRVHNEYELKYIFNIEFFQNDFNYTINYLYPKYISEDEFFKIIFEIYLKVARISDKIEISSKELSSQDFSILYYTNIQNSKDFKFICTPPISNSKLVMILSCLVNEQ